MPNAQSADGEVLLALPVSREKVPPATKIRGAYLLSSLKGLRERGHYPAYARAMGEEGLGRMQGIVASEWLPIELGVQHYAACETLDLPTDELLALGQNAITAAFGSVFGVVGRLGIGVGIGPAEVFAASDRYRARMFVGTALSVVRLGPKEVRFEHVGMPFARFRFNRVGARGILMGVASAFSRKVYVTELTEFATATSLAFRIAWA